MDRGGGGRRGRETERGREWRAREARPRQRQGLTVEMAAMPEMEAMDGTLRERGRGSACDGSEVEVVKGEGGKWLSVCGVLPKDGCSLVVDFSLFYV